MPRTRTTGGGGAGGAPNFFTGQYQGDNAATQAIVGIGFRPRYVLIWAHGGGGNNVTAWKTNIDVANAELMTAALGFNWYVPDMIVSLDANGFTVGDGTGIGNVLNTGGMTYTYVCM